MWLKKEKPKRVKHVAKEAVKKGKCVTPKARTPNTGGRERLLLRKPWRK